MKALASLFLLASLLPSGLRGLTDSALVPDASSRVNIHTRLKFRNDFKKPEEVVNYYCGRDASGFVWSGLLDIERRAFTVWNTTPEHDAFYIARKYKIGTAKVKGQNAEVKVKYELTGMGDAHGTRMPAAQRIRTVTFRLIQIDGSWKIRNPDPAELAPVIVEEKFPTAVD